MSSAMLKKKSLKNFFQYTYEKSSDINKKIINDIKVKKHLKPKTEKNYACVLNL